MRRISVFALALIVLMSAENIEDLKDVSKEIKTNNEVNAKKEAIKTTSMSAKDKSGFLLGLEANLSQNLFNQYFSFTPNVKLPNISGVNWVWREGAYMQGNQSQVSFGFDGGIRVGYQHYFSKKMD